jgi:hypothetical protein
VSSPSIRGRAPSFDALEDEPTQADTGSRSRRSTASAPPRFRAQVPRRSIGDDLEARSARSARAPQAEQRYVPLEVLGRGGMGEVTLALDLKVGREIALKSMLPTNADVEALYRARFEREATIQALLEHPSIVPVYDVELDPDRPPRFVMRRIVGETLFDQTEALRREREVSGSTKGLRRLLSAFVTVCLAVDYAHARGVIHRDLKPENVMLGPSGEVYVLDWGVAKVVAPGAASPAPTESTSPGELVGTPGFMSPEQALGLNDEVDARSDVYALGSILFEVITQSPLYDASDGREILRATLDGSREPPPCPAHAPPELYSLALAACAYERERRLPSARALADAVERYLDGDRDAALRAQLADAQAVHAAQLASEAARATGREQMVLRAQAIGLAGRALALAPEHEEAARLVLELLATPPDEVPPEVDAELRVLVREHARAALGRMATRIAMWLIPSALMLALGVRVTWLAALLVVVLLGCVGYAVVLHRTHDASARSRAALFLGASLLAALGTAIFGPLVFIPSFATANVLLFLGLAPPGRRWAFVAVGTLTFLIPLALELVGLLPPSMRFDAGGLTLVPRLTELPRGLTLVVLSLVAVMGIVFPARIVVSLRDGLIDLERKLLLQKWQLSQLTAPTSRLAGAEQARPPRARAR